MALDFGRTDTVKTQEKLLAGSSELLSEYGITLVSGQNLTRGAPLGRITTTGKYTEWDPNASDGSQNFVSVLAEDVDASSADEKGVAYMSGRFWYSGMIWDSDKHQGDDILDAILAGHARSIFIVGFNIGLLESSWTSTTTTTSTSTSNSTTTTTA